MRESRSSLVSNPSDPYYQFLRTLRTFQGRAQSSHYLIEGIRHVARAFQEAAAFHSIFLETSALENPFGRKLVQRLRRRGVKTVRLTPGLYRGLTEANEPQGMGAVLKERWHVLTDIDLLRETFWLVVEAVELPGNLGTILRTAEAAGVSGVILIGDPDPYDPVCVRATMGALFSLKLIRCHVQEFVRWANSRDVTVIGSSPRGMVSYRGFRFRWPAALVVGNEREGVSAQLIDCCAFTLKIPMRGKSDSINASVAAGVLLFELAAHVRHR